MFDTIYFITIISFLILMASIYFTYLAKCNASTLKSDYVIVNKSAKNILTNIDSKLHLYFLIGLTSIASSINHNYIATIFFLCIVCSFIKTAYDYKLLHHKLKKEPRYLNIFYKYLDNLHFTGLRNGMTYEFLDEQEKYIHLLKQLNKQDYELYEELLLVILNEDSIKYNKVLNLIKEYDAINLHNYKKSDTVQGLKIRFKKEVFKALNINYHSK